MAFARFSQARLLFGPPCGGLPYRRGRLHVMLRTGELLDPLKGLCHGASPVGSRLAAAVSYRAAWSLPGPDFHWLVSVNLRGTRFADPPPFVGARYWARPNRGNLRNAWRDWLGSPVPKDIARRRPGYLELRKRCASPSVITDYLSIKLTMSGAWRPHGPPSNREHLRRRGRAEQRWHQSRP